MAKFTAREIQIIEVCRVREGRCRGCLYQGESCAAYVTKYNALPLTHYHITIKQLANSKGKKED